MDELEETLRSKIMLEEKYRADVRTQLEQAGAKDKKKPVMAFLNSSFGLWALSAIFITGAGSLYTQWHTKHQESQKKQEQDQAEAKRLSDLHQRMEMEVAHRMSETLIRLSDISEAVDHHKLRPGYTAADVKQILDDFAVGTGSRLAPLYPDLANQSALAMVTELSKQPGADSQALSKAVGDLSGLSVLLEVEGAPPSDPFHVAAALLTRFRVLKFKGDFYFLDCGAQDPFC